MWSGTSFTEDSDGVEKMPRHEAETEAEKWYAVHKYCGGQAGPCDDARQTRCLNCDKLDSMFHGGTTDPGRRRKKQTRSRVQHCPSCHCPPDPARPSTGLRQKYARNASNAYEPCLEDPERQACGKSRSTLQLPRYSGAGREPTRRRQTSGHRRQGRTDEDRVMLAMMADILNLGENDICDVCYEYFRSMGNGCKAEAAWRDERTTPGIVGNADPGERFPQRKRDRSSKRESAFAGRRAPDSGKLTAAERREMDEHEDEEGPRSRGLLRFHPVRQEEAGRTNSKDVEKASDDPPESCRAPKAGGPRAPTLIKNDDGPPRHRTSIGEANDRSRSEDSGNFSHRRIAARPDSAVGSPDEESPLNKEENANDEEQDPASSSRNIYAGGDLDLWAHKNDMIRLIERVIGSKLGASVDQQKNVESEQGISTEIARALRNDRSLAEEPLDRREWRTDCISRLKVCRWEYMKRIQNELAQLCTLQKFLDSYSPRQASQDRATIESRFDAVEQRPEERQQHEDKQKMGTIP